MCSRADLDSHRFMRSLRSAIDARELPSYPPFVAWEKRVKRTPEPTVDPLAPSVASGGRAGAMGDGGLAGAIALRQRERGESLLSSLEAKYGGGGGGGGGAKGKGRRAPEPSDEEFAAARARVEAAKSPSTGGPGAGPEVKSAKRRAKGGEPAAAGGSKKKGKSK